ncbi:MAG TPA: hypothetical protein VKT80_04505, partial [Chloroflexota bacterium]|nr:hypothetical protein [Chloroflexota bacterium]
HRGNSLSRATPRKYASSTSSAGAPDLRRYPRGNAANPAIIATDDDWLALNSVGRDLRQKYGCKTEPSPRSIAGQ